MNNMKIITVLLISTFLFVFGCTTETTQADSNEEGRVLFTITDAAADMGAVSEVNITIDSIQVQDSNGAWTTVSTEARTYDLLELKAQNRTALFADTNLAKGEYNKLRLNVSNVTVVDDEGSHEAKMPSGKIDIQSMLKVDANSTSTAKFDFIADESLHLTGQGEYIMAPVIQVETRSNTRAQIQSANQVNASVAITGGKTDTNAKVGMDLNGNVGAGIRVPANINISVTTDALGNVVSMGSSPKGNAGVGGSGSVTIDTNDGTNVEGEVGIDVGVN